jgi:putative oxidoreductase
MLPYTFAALRIVLGVLFVVMGLSYFIPFLPEVPISPRGAAFLEALLATGYLFPLIKVLEIACGLLLLSGRAVLPALLLIAPVSVNIALYHAFLDPNGAWIGFLAAGLALLLLLPFHTKIAGLFHARPGFASTDRPSVAGPIAMDVRQAS